MRHLPLILLLTACATPLPLPDTDKIYRFQIRLVDSMPGTLEGLHTYDEKLDLHTIFLIKSKYPRCIGHEALHVIHGKYHKGKVSTEYC